MTDRAKKLRQEADEATAQAMRRIQDSGELSHLYGRPLQLDDDPEWLVTRLLKQQGFSHPILERARELDEPRGAVEQLVERLLRRRRRALAAPPGRRGTEAQEFNRWRESALDQLRDRLATLNRAIRDYNLQAPAALHQRPVLVEEELERIHREIPDIDCNTLPEEPRVERVSLWRRLRPPL